MFVQWIAKLLIYRIVLKVSAPKKEASYLKVINESQLNAINNFHKSTPN